MRQAFSFFDGPAAVLSDGWQFQNRLHGFLSDSNLLLCRDGGACCFDKEDDIELAASAIVIDMVIVGRVAIAAEPYQDIVRYLNEADRLFCLSVKDGSV